MWTALLNAIASIGAVFNFASKRSDVRNAQDVKDAKIAKSEQDEVTADTKAVASRDLDEVRRRFSE